MIVRLRNLVVVVVAALAVAPVGVAGQNQGSGPTTYARRGMVIGAISGGVAGGLSLGVLVSGLCEFDCDNAFLEGFLIGLAGGGVFGGVSGLVIGAAIPREDSEAIADPAEPWALGVGVGPRVAGQSPFEGTDLWVGVTALRPTTSSIRWGVEFAYLGRGSETNVFNTVGRDGSGITFTDEWRRSIWNLSLVAARRLGQDRGSGLYVLANVGAYPLSESLTSERIQTPPDPLIPTRVAERKFSVVPGVGIGGGGLVDVGARGEVGFESRLHVIVGAGDESVLTLFSVGAVLRLKGR